MALLPPLSHDWQIGDYSLEKKMGLFEYDSKKSIGYTRRDFKSMSLFFDKIYIDLFDYTVLRSNGQRLPKDAVFLSHEITGGIGHYIPDKSSNLINPFPDEDADLYAFTVGVLKEADINKVNLTPIYGTLHHLENYESENKINVVNQRYECFDLAFEVFPGIEEAKLEWKQVDEIRSDVESIGGFRKIRKLLELIQGCENVVEAEDRLGEKIADYKHACKKHGVKTVETTFNQLYKKETVISAMGAGLLTGELGLSIAVGGLKLGFDIVLNVNKSIRDKRYLSDQHPEACVAMIYKDIN